MRILSILQHSPPAKAIGGAERQMHSLHKGLISLGVDVHVLADIAVVGNAYQEFEGVPIWGIRFPVLTSDLFRPGNALLLKRLFEIAWFVKSQIGPFDVIQATMFKMPALVAGWLSIFTKAPVVVRLACSGVQHGDFAYIRGNWLLRLCLPAMIRRTDVVVALDEATRTDALLHGVPRNKIRTIPNTVVLEITPSLPEADGNVKSGDIVFIGRICEKKRIDTLLSAFDRFVSTEWANNLVVVGGGDLEWLRNEVELSSVISGRVDVTGFDPNPEKYLSHASCFINPSEGEGMPNAVLEACAFGVPVILSDIPVHRDIAVSVGMENFLFPVGNSADLARKMSDFFSLPEETIRTLRHNCAEYARRFSREDRDQEYLGLYESVTRQCNNESSW